MKTAIIFASLIVAGSALLKKPVRETAEHTLLAPSKGTAKRTHSTSLPKAPVRIVVDKSNYELYVYDAEGWFATYPVVFGNSSLDDKMVEGDKNTPEGEFKIVNKRVHEKWDRYMGLDYPTKESLAKFNQWKKAGKIPAGATPGGGIGIHGTWPHEGFVIDRYKNWTNGCISLKNEDIEDLYGYISVGTPITIRK